MIKSLQVKSVFWLAVVTWALILVVSGEPISSALVKPAGLTLAIITAAVALFDKYIWRVKVFHPWLILTPDLNGTYRGTLESSWIDPTTGKSPQPIETFVSIRQTLSGISIRMMTAESQSISLAASICYEEDGKSDVVFGYRNEPSLNVQHRSRIHHGGSRLAIDGEEDSRLRGPYWTDRNTFGEIELSRISRKQSRSVDEARKLGLSSAK